MNWLSVALNLCQLSKKLYSLPFFTFLFLLRWKEREVLVGEELHWFLDTESQVVILDTFSIQSSVLRGIDRDCWLRPSW